MKLKFLLRGNSWNRLVASRVHRLLLPLLAVIGPGRAHCPVEIPHPFQQIQQVIINNTYMRRHYLNFFSSGQGAMEEVAASVPTTVETQVEVVCDSPASASAISIDSRSNIV